MTSPIKSWKPLQIRSAHPSLSSSKSPWTVESYPRTGSQQTSCAPSRKVIAILPQTTDLKFSLTSVSCKILEHIACHHILFYLKSNNILTNLNHGFRSGYSTETQLLTYYNSRSTPFFRPKQTDRHGYLGLQQSLRYSSSRPPSPEALFLRHLWFATRLAVLLPHGTEHASRGWEHLLQAYHCWLRSAPRDCARASPISLLHQHSPRDGIITSPAFCRRLPHLPRNQGMQGPLYPPAGPETPWRSGREVGDALQRHQMLRNEHRTAPRNHVHVLAEQHTPEVSLFKPLSWNFILQPPHLEPTHQHHQEGKQHPWIHSKESPSMPNCLQENCLPRPGPPPPTVLEYGAIIWDPYQKQDISKMERIQRNAVRFNTRDYKFKTPGSVTSLLTKYDLPTLQERREDLRLTFLCKVVGGLVTAIPPEKYLNPQKASRNIHPPNRSDYIVQNPVHNQSQNHNCCLEIPSYNTEQYKQSFFPRTIIAWNKLNTSTVQASSLEAFKSALAVARRWWGAPTPRTQPRRNLHQTTDIITMRCKTLWRLGGL